MTSFLTGSNKPATSKATKARGTSLQAALEEAEAEDSDEDDVEAHEHDDEANANDEIQFRAKRPPMWIQMNPSVRPTKPRSISTPNRCYLGVCSKSSHWKVKL